MPIRLWLCIGTVLGFTILTGCTRERPLFTRMEQTGISFENRIVEQDAFNVLEYEYFYNGAGVAVGDLNQDGLVDLYFTANMAADRLYLNRGNWSFEEITEQAGITHGPTWTTGVTMADVNGDGLLDIYVCRSGNVTTDRRRNSLYINQGDLTFKDEAAAYGLDDPSYSNHATFFDYDNDGDLDMYLLNHSIRRYSHFVVDYMRAQRDSLAGDKLFRNDAGIFTDVSEEAGILGNPLSYGLSVVVSDMNGDLWPDLYISNDYIEDDYLYINQQDGTFSESIRSYLTHASYASMGVDIADINNDLQPDIYTLDMLAEDNYRQKVLKGPEDYKFYTQLRIDGFHEQYMRNMLHLRRGPDYVEIGQLAGVSNTDWSWAPLFADLDRDLLKDLIVTNGYLRDYTDLDFLSTTLPNASRQAQMLGEAVSGLEMVEQMPTTRVPNYVFRGVDGLQFQDVTTEWGFELPTHSNGMVLTDLDGDLDLDVVISNINQDVLLYRNEAEEQGRGGTLRITLEGPPGNEHGIGAKVLLHGEEKSIMQEAFFVRGYLSSLEPALFFGTGEWDEVDVEIYWPDGRFQRLEKIATRQTIQVKYSEAYQESITKSLPGKEFIAVDLSSGLNYQHREDDYSDWDQQPLLPRDLAQEGPAIASGDINGDRLTDIFIGGGRGQAATLFLQQIDRTYTEIGLPVFEQHAEYEDVDAILLDLSGDGLLDLYVASGAGPRPEYWQDRLYINTGFGGLVYVPNLLPPMQTVTSSIAPYDIDSDGDTDLFVGGLHLPGQFGRPPRSYLLENTPDGFQDRTVSWAPDLQYPGMITTAVWADVRGDDKMELLIAGHWMPIRAYCISDSGILEDCSGQLGLTESDGFWNQVIPADLDMDGDMDLIAGNRGLNTQIQASPQYPATLYAGDLDNSGTWETLYSSYVKGIDVSVASRDQIVAQLPDVRIRFPRYSDYAAATTDEIMAGYDPPAIVLKAKNSSSVIFELTDEGIFNPQPLPLSAQFSPVRDALALDFNDDGNLDIFLIGNDYSNRAEEGRMSSGRGLMLVGDGELGFTDINSGNFWIRGDTRRIVKIDHRIIVVSNNDQLNVFQTTE